MTTYKYPRNTVWLVEAKGPSTNGRPPKAQYGSAIAIRLRNSATGKIQNYLLTCLHVVCSLEFERSNNVLVSMEALSNILVWPPGHGFNDSQAKQAVRSEVTPIQVDIIGKPLSIGNDWVLLEVSDSSFQKTHVVRSWDHPDAAQLPSYCTIIGYPDGPAGFQTGIVENLHLKRVPITRSGDDFCLTTDGDHTRPGMSGGGVFTDGVLLGVHRSAAARIAAMHSVKASDIREELSELNLYPVKRTLGTQLLEGASEYFVSYAGFSDSTARKAAIGTYVVIGCLLLALSLSLAAFLKGGGTQSPYREIENLATWLSFVAEEHDTDDFDLVLAEEAERLQDNQRFLEFSAAITDIPKDPQNGSWNLSCSPANCEGITAFPSAFEIEVAEDLLGLSFDASSLRPQQGRYRQAWFRIELGYFNWKSRQPTGKIFAHAAEFKLKNEILECPPNA